MRRERRRFERNDTDIKKVLYTAGGILFISIITFIAMFLLNSNNSQEEQRLAMFNTEMMNSSNNANSIEETSSQTGRTVNEMLNEMINDMATNELTTGEANEDANESSTNETSSNSDKTKYAVNTSNVEGKKVEENADSTKDSETTKKEDEETVKDPEFKMPVEGEIMREYAKDNLVYSATLDEWVTHNGIDIAAEKTTVVKASAEGTVKSIKNDPRYGLTIVIEHVNGFTTVYSNLLTAEFVEEGETVEQGETIGTVGNTATFEIADEAHLHFEILKDNENLDPELYLK